jgi:hypothetical protein
VTHHTNREAGRHKKKKANSSLYTLLSMDRQTTDILFHSRMARVYVLACLYPFFAPSSYPLILPSLPPSPPSLPTPSVHTPAAQNKFCLHPRGPSPS